jgi:hypothetical protein
MTIITQNGKQGTSRENGVSIGVPFSLAGVSLFFWHGFSWVEELEI